MDINEILQQVDTLYEENKGPEAEQVMLAGIVQAVEVGDNGALLQLLNELLGYYRETSQVENSYAIAMQAMYLAEQMGLKDSIPYATTLLNVANAYRAGGRLGESLELYLQVRDIYDRTLSKDNMLVASFENNLSLLYQELGDFVSAKEALLKALAIVTAKEADFEIAVTHTNLASSCVQLGQISEAFDYAEKAVKEFEKMQVEDTHYCAALSALGTCYFEEKQYGKALAVFERALSIMEKNPARTEYYYRLQERCTACREILEQCENAVKQKEEACRGDEDVVSQGMALCRQYYECYGKPMLLREFPEYLDKIAVGLVGEGSDCFGYDDAFSRDHDYGPDFCLWVTEETYAEIGEKLCRAYAALPTEFAGCKRNVGVQGAGRRGVLKISEFYQRLLGTDKWEEIDWQQVPDSGLAAAVNGDVFVDNEGVFSEMRDKLKDGYPLSVRYLKMAQAAALFSQNTQYNFLRMYKRGDMLTAEIMLSDGIKEAFKLQHYLEGKYPPHEKWLHRSTRESEAGRRLSDLADKCLKLWAGCRMESERQSLETMEQVQKIVEEIAGLLVAQLYEQSFISDMDNYLDVHTPELAFKASIAEESVESLAERIAKLEFEAFDKVENEGGRASCQNDWATFRVMRMSQYLTWNHTMLMQYLYDFTVEFGKGHNLITEKYGRMMEYTDKEAYDTIKSHFPALSEEKKAVIEQIVGIQVAWMEEFAEEYPHLADNARSIHSYEDHRYHTSYETYLRGELSTYSDKMLQLYGRYVVEYARSDKNLTYDIMSHSVRMYGYKDLQAAEEFWAK